MTSNQPHAADSPSSRLMRSRCNLPPSFRFDLRGLLTEARRRVNSRVDGISINLPFISFRINPTDLEKKAAREIVIRMADRRVLNASECCDSCIDQALTSLKDIRGLLVDKQVELSHAVDIPLYFLIELQLEAIRQFLTFEQWLNSSPSGAQLVVPGTSDFRRPRMEATLSIRSVFIRSSVVMANEISSSGSRQGEDRLGALKEPPRLRK